MARKFAFDSSITKDIMAATSDSFIDNLKMIDISEIKLNKENFYELSEIEILADDIERQGLKHNLVVSEDKDGSGYWLKSGHRRYSAIKLLIDSGRISGSKLPCFIDGVKTQSEAKLDLIMLNATQRKYTDAETMQEYAELEQTFKSLEAEGKGLKGRMRENIAKALNVSPAQVGKIENIKNNAIEAVTEAVSRGEMSISTANEVAKLKPTAQKNLLEEKKPTEITHKEVKQLRNEAVKPVPMKREVPKEDTDNYDLYESDNYCIAEIDDDGEETEYCETTRSKERQRDNAVRLASVLSQFSEEDYTVRRIASFLKYDPEQLKKDMVDIWREIQK